MRNQKNEILNFLRNSNTGMTSWDAIQHCRCTRLAARILDLKEKENLTDQEMVDKYFDTEELGTYKETDDYYEVTSV